MTRSDAIPEDPHALAVARGRAYDLLGHALRHGVTRERLDHLRAVPALAGLLSAADVFDPDAAAAAHHTTFSLEVPPFESVFLTESGLMGGAPAAGVRAQASRVGFSDLPDDMEPDHAGVQLAVLCWLSGAEADAWADEKPDVASVIQGLIREFLDAHPLGWLGALAASLSTCSAADPVLTEVVRLASELCHSHRADLGAPTEQAALPTVPPVLEDPETGLRRIAEVLTTPVYAGGFLCRSAIADLGRAHDLPRGFGGRCQTLVNLLRSAAQFDRLVDVVDGLDRVASTWANDHCSEPWRDRAQSTQSWLTQMRTQVAALVESSPE